MTFYPSIYQKAHLFQVKLKELETCFPTNPISKKANDRLLRYSNLKINYVSVSIKLSYCKSPALLRDIENWYNNLTF